MVKNGSIVLYYQYLLNTANQNILYLQERKRISKYITHMDTTLARIAYVCSICSGGIMIPICYPKYEKNTYTTARLQV